MSTQQIMFRQICTSLPSVQLRSNCMERITIENLAYPNFRSVPFEPNSTYRLSHHLSKTLQMIQETSLFLVLSYVIVYGWLEHGFYMLMNPLVYSAFQNKWRNPIRSSVNIKHATPSQPRLSLILALYKNHERETIIFIDAAWMDAFARLAGTTIDIVEIPSFGSRRRHAHLLRKLRDELHTYSNIRCHLQRLEQTGLAL